MSESTAPNPVYCANHPNVETSLHCSRCEKPICVRCVVRTPTGYRCKSCVQSQQKAFETATNWDPWIAFAVAVPLSFLGSLFLPRFILFAILLSPVAGGLMAEVVRFAVGRRRSPQLFKLAAVGALLGALPMAGLEVISLISWIFSAGTLNLSFIWSLVGYAVYLFLVPTTLYYRLSGTNLRM